MIGVTVAIESLVRANAGIGFAIPVSIVEEAIPKLIENGSYQTSYVGISGIDLTQELAELMEIDTSQQGVLIMRILPGSSAEKAGLIAGDQEVFHFGQHYLIGG